MLNNAPLEKLARPFGVVATDIKATDFQGRYLAVLEGEKAVAAQLADLRAKLARVRER